MTTPLRAGSLTRLVSIQQRTVTQDSYGGQSQTWTEIKKVYAGMESLSGTERAAAQAVSTDISHRFTVRYDAIFADPKLVAAYRIVYQTRIFDIQASMNLDEANHVIELLAAEGMTLG
jgi:SPP1 family predicted phage head-tail adaptor